VLVRRFRYLDLCDSAANTLGHHCQIAAASRQVWGDRPRIMGDTSQYIIKERSAF